VGEGTSRTCALIDPAFEPKKILKETERLGFKVTHVINTHGHSDHTSGNAQIIAATGAKLLIHELDAKKLEKFFSRAFSRLLGGQGSPPPDRLLKDDDVINIGKVPLRVIHTPGHTRGGICIYTQGHLFTGDTLFVGAVGRTDLGGGSMLILLQSVKKKLYTLPDETIVWPGHDYGVAPSSTIAHEKRTNPATMVE